MIRLAVLAFLAAAPALAQTAGPAGRDVTKWDGASHAEYFASPVEWARFQAVVTSEEFREIRQGTEMNTRTRIEDGFLVLTGCFKRSCPFTRAGLAVEVATGRPMAVVWQRDEGARFYGARGGRMAPALTRLAETGVLE